MVTPERARNTGPTTAQADPLSATAPEQSATWPDLALEIKGVSKTFAGNRVLDNVDLAVRLGEIRALLGGNGSGKSTLIKILSGYHHSDDGAHIMIGGQPLVEGDARSSRDQGARFVHQELGLVASSSVLDNLALTGGFPTSFGTIRGRSAKAQARVILETVGLDIDPAAMVQTLSAAERTGVALAAAVHGIDAGGVRLLVLDEPTATLPASEVSTLLAMVRRIADRGVGVVYVTHRLDEVFELGATITVLRSGRHIVTTTSAELDRAALVRYLVGDEFDEASREAHQLAPSDSIDAIKPALVVTGLQSENLEDVSFELRPGEVVGLSGLTGSGREVVAATVFGALPRQGGTVSVLGRPIPPNRTDAAIQAGLGYLPSDRHELGGIDSLSAVDNLTIAKLRSRWGGLYLRTRAQKHEGAKWFARLNVKPEDGLEKPLFTFSGGNQQKILFAKWLRLEPEVLLLDEPTQGVDVGAKAQIHHQVLQYAAAGAAVLVTSSDIDELVALCGRVLIIRSGRIVDDLRGADVSIPVVTRESVVSDHPPAPEASHPTEG